jgi:SAM-dependent methyltransferase
VCERTFPIVNGIPDLRPPAAQALGEADWAVHWSDERQRSPVQRFFSFWRKAVFARGVAYFINRWFAPEGVFVEAGSGTSETSIRIDRLGRTLVALDVVLPVLRSCPPVIDVRICGDIFRLPLLDNSVDGIWNVGVMEHFTRSEIDAILSECHRVLRPGAPLILLWPAIDSIPQKMLAAVELIVNLKPRPQRFRFHPAEISRLRSNGQARTILADNGFGTSSIDFGLRTLMAFKTVIGYKRGAAMQQRSGSA